MHNDTLIKHLLEAQKNISHATAEKTNPQFGSKYVSLEALWDYAKPILNEQEIYIQQISHESDIGACIETVLFGHGGYISTGRLTVKAERQTCQGFGSATTYAKRYSLSMALGIGADKDDDGNAAEKDQKTGKPAATKPAPTKQPPKADPAGRYVLQLKGATIVTHSNTSSFLAACRDHLANPQDQRCIDIFASSKQSILEAQQASEGDQRSAYDTLVKLYGS